jgi:hypothetical protein
MISESVKKAIRKYQKRHYAEQRAQIISILGGKCTRCGFSDRRALCIDHINGGGSKEIRAHGPGIYKRYLDRNCTGLQILCANCNMIKKHENKEFPFNVVVQNA